MKHIALLLVVFFTVFAVAQTTSYSSSRATIEVAKVTTYSDDTLGFTIDSPIKLDKKVSKEKTGNGQPYDVIMFNGQDDDGLYVVSIGVQPAGTTVPAAVLKGLIDDFNKAGKVTTISDDIVSNQPAIRFVFVTPAEAEGHIPPLKTLMLATFKDNKLYMVSFTTPMGYDPPDHERILAFFNSFKLLDPPTEKK